MHGLPIQLKIQPDRTKINNISIRLLNPVKILLIKVYLLWNRRKGIRSAKLTSREEARVLAGVPGTTTSKNNERTRVEQQVVVT